MKRIKLIAGLACLSLFAAMALGSGSTSSSSVDKEIQSVSTVTDDAKTDDANLDNSDSDTMTEADSSDMVIEEEKDDVSASSEATVDEQVVFDERDIKITVTGLEDGWMGTELKMLIENNSSQGITVQAWNSNVNGFMVDSSMSADVAAGKKANDELTLFTSGLKDCGIEQIADIEFYFHIFDIDTWDTIVDSDIITVKTSIADTYVQAVDDSGEVLVDEKGIKIVAKGLSSDDSFWGPGIILYIENNSNENVTIQVRDVSINGFMVDTSMSEDVVVGKKALSAVQFFSSDLEENSITDISDVELYFHIFDEATWDTVFDSDVIKITF